MEHEMKQILEILGTYGLPIALVVYFIWRDYEREKTAVVEKDKMVRQINDLQSEVRNILTKLVSETSAIIVSNSESMRDWLELLKLRPCLADELAKKMLDELKKDRNT